MEKKIVISIISLVILVGAATLLLTKRETAGETPNQATPPMENEDQAMEGEEEMEEGIPADWETFMDEQVGYSVEHPPDWFSYPAKAPNGESAIYSYDISKVDGRGGVPSNELKFAVIRFTKEQNEDLYTPPSEQETVKETKVTIDGEMGTRLKTESAITISVEHEGYVYHINAFPADSEHLPTLETMLTSFKFL